MSDLDFQHLVDRYYEPLYRFGYSLTRKSDDACDLTQQTFFIWARQGHALRDPSKVKSWLFTTLYREFIKLYRHGQRTTLVEQQELEATVCDIEPDSINRLDGETVIQALNDVDELYRAPLTLFYLEELSYKEIADVLRVPIGTVMSRLSRGKDQLRRLLQRPPQTESGSDVIILWTDSERRQNHG